MTPRYGEGTNAETRLREKIKIAREQAKSSGASLDDRKGIAQPNGGPDRKIASTPSTSPSVTETSAKSVIASHLKGDAEPKQPASGPDAKAQYTWSLAYDTIIMSEETSALATEYIDILTQVLGTGEPEKGDTGSATSSTDLQDPAKRNLYLKMMI
jgi:hypothetical protein